MAYKEALSYLHEAMAAEKCRACGCFHHLLVALDKAFPEGEDLSELKALMKEANSCLTDSHCSYLQFLPA